jgi:hypothetical protein
VSSKNPYVDVVVTAARIFTQDLADGRTPRPHSHPAILAAQLSWAEIALAKPDSFWDDEYQAEEARAACRNFNALVAVTRGPSN